MARKDDAEKDSKKDKKKAKKKFYEKELRRLQAELCHLQAWVKHKGLRVIILFEGRDGAGKGGTIRAITERVSPRVFRVVALPAPSDREKSQMYVQRYMQHFPAAGEILIFDRSWYNRAGVEYVMGFCSKEQYKAFLQVCPEFEEYITRGGIILLKYWLEVSNEEQAKRFAARIEDPLRQWKLSPMDLPSREKWYEYSAARDRMLEATDTKHAPWNIVRSDDKKKARLNVISHLLKQIPYKQLPAPKIKLAKRSKKHAYDDEASIKGRRFIPEKYLTVAAIGWLASYDRRWFAGDAIAGLTLAAYLLPAALGDASLAGLPPEAGLYAVLFGGLVFWAFCSSRHTAVSVTSALSLLIGVSIGPLAGGDPARFAQLAALTAVITAALAFAAWAARAGVVVNFVSETVLVGFKCGVAFVLASTQVPKLLGFKGGEGDFWSRAAHIIGHIGETHAASLWLGLAALAVLIAGKKFLPNRPVALLVVAAGIVATSVFDLSARGVHTLGIVPQGLPAFGFPIPGRADINGVLPIAMAAFLLASVETAAIGRMFALKHGYRFDPNREFLAIGSANLMSGLGRGFPISGGLSQSLVNESAGARTPLSGLVAALIIGTITLFFTGLLSDLPQPVLAAIVLVAVAGLVHVSVIRRLWRFGHEEFGVAALAFLGVLGSGILQGVMIGAVLSILLLLRRGSRPNAVELGRVGNTARFASLRGAPDRTRVPGVFVFRVDGALLYFNVEHVRDQFAAQLSAREDPIQSAVFSLGSVPNLDLAGADLLIDLRRHLAARGIDLRLAGARGEVQQDLVRAGFDAVASGAYASVDAALGHSPG